MPSCIWWAARPADLNGQQGKRVKKQGRYFHATAMRWAAGSGILNGSNGNLVPQGTTAPAQAAAMIARYGGRIGA